MKNIIPPPDLTITVLHFCHYCEVETDHVLDFLAYSYEHHAVSYTLCCENCQDERALKEYIPQWLPVNEWLEMLSDISDGRTN